VPAASDAPGAGAAELPSHIDLRSGCVLASLGNASSGSGGLTSSDAGPAASSIMILVAGRGPAPCCADAQRHQYGAVQGVNRPTWPALRTEPTVLGVGSRAYRVDLDATRRPLPSMALLPAARGTDDGAGEDEKEGEPAWLGLE